MNGIEQRLLSAMAVEPDVAPNWAGVEASLERRHRNRVRGMRAALASFTAAILLVGVSLLTGTSGIERDIVPADGANSADPEDAYRTPAIVAAGITALIGVGLLMTGRRTAHSHELAGWRRFWPLAVLVPIAYPVAQFASLESGWSALAQAFAIPCYPVLCWLLAERIAERPGRWATAAVLWAGIGMTTVLSTIALTDEVLERANVAGLWRLWPGRGGEAQAQTLPGLDHPPGPNWTVEAIAARELIAVVSIAFAAGVALRMCRRWPRWAAGIVPLVVWCGLGIYETATPWGFTWDYDPFVSDAVLGSMFGELMFPVAPIDLVSAVGLGVAALSMGALLWSWGGPMPSPQRPSATGGEDDEPLG